MEASLRKRSYSGTVWTPEEDEQIRRLGPELGGEAMARLLHRSVDATRKRAGKLGVSLKKAGGTGTPWTPEEDAVLREHALKTPWVEIADMLGRTAPGCEYRAKALGLVHSPERKYHPPTAKEGMRACHDCGRPTWDYRCSACWRKLRAEKNYSMEDGDE